MVFAEETVHVDAVNKMGAVGITRRQGNDTRSIQTNFHTRITLDRVNGFRVKDFQKCEYQNPVSGLKVSLGTKWLLC